MNWTNDQFTKRLKIVNALQDALLSGNLEEVEQHLFDLPLKKKNTTTSIERCQRIIQLLLSAEKNLNIHYCNYAILLHFAALHKDEESFNYLLSTGDFNINSRSPDGYTLLHVAIWRGTNKMVRALLEAGADVDAKCITGDTPLHYAIKINNTGMVLWLLRFGASTTCTTSERITPLHYAAYLGNFEIAEIILNTGANVNSLSFEGSPLHFACGEAVSGNTCLSHVKDLRIVQLLLAHGANVNAKNLHGKTPLHSACSKGYLDVVEVLLQHGATLSYKCKKGNTALRYGASSNNAKLVKLLLQKGLDPNAKNRFFRTPMYYSIRETPDPDLCLPVIELLIEYGADVNATIGSNTTILHETCSNVKYDKITKYLLHVKADINANDKHGFTPVHCAVLALRYPTPGLTWQASLSTLRILLMHIAILIATEKYVCPSVLNLIEKDPQIQEIYKACKLEIINMKKEKISCLYHFSYFELLKHGFHTPFAKNQCLMNTLSLKKYTKMFPEGASFLTDCIEEGRRRRNYITLSSRILKKHTKQNIPCVVTDRLFSYLNELDLLNFLKAFFIDMSDFINIINRSRFEDIKRRTDYDSPLLSAVDFQSNVCFDRPHYYSPKKRCLIGHYYHW